MLETIREYALEQLSESGELVSLQRRHATYFLRLAEEAEPELHGPQQAAWFDRLEREHDNLRAALRWAVETAHAEEGLRAAGALWFYWYNRGYLNEGRERLTALLAVPVASRAMPGRAKALFTAGMLAWYQGDHAAAQALHEEGLTLQRQLGDRQGIASALFGLGQVALGQGRYATARGLHEESLAIRRELGDTWAIGFSLVNMGVVAVGQGDYTLARSLFEEGLALRREAGDRRGVAVVLLNLADVVDEQGDYGAAQASYQESLAIARELGDKWLIAHALAGLAGVTALQGQPVHARDLAATATALFETIGSVTFPGWGRRFDTRLERARHAVGPDRGATTRAEGRVLPLDQAVASALAPEAPVPQTMPAPGVPADARRGRPGEQSVCLTRREREVAVLIARGYANRQIAAELVIAERTAETHVEHILVKLALVSRAQVAVWAVEHGLLGKVAPTAAPASRER
jgi:DNA-binding CsgD family transcriptional regulator/tetratricopeptide (TPR) repeat protein